MPTVHTCSLPWPVPVPVRRHGYRSIARQNAVLGARCRDVLPETEMTPGISGRRRCRGSK